MSPSNQSNDYVRKLGLYGAPIIHSFTDKIKVNIYIII
nr:hypothetical protein [Clostridium tyrobutyricum]